MRRIPHFRWCIITLVFLAAVLNYVDRQTLSTLAPSIQHDLGMNDRDYANVVNLFLVAYTIAYLISGRIVDLLGTRVGTIVFVAWWSVSNMLTAAAQGVASLGVYRGLLGLGEAGIWPAASKVVSEWFPARERALAIGLYTMGATVGATVAPYVVIRLAQYRYEEKLPWLAHTLGNGTGWRVAFILTGAAGLLWLIPWTALYRLPAQSSRVTAEELSLIEQAQAEEARKVAEERASADVEPPWTWRKIFSTKIVWMLILGRLITDPVWYFYQFWFPKYLHAERGLNQEQIKITWIIYAAAGAGSLVGGWLSGVLVKRGSVPARSRLWVMLGCACLLPVSPLISMVTGLPLALTFAIVAVFASLAWLINLSSLVVDLVPKNSLGTVFSVVGTGSTLGGLMMNTIVAAMVTGAAKPVGFLDCTITTVLSPILQAVEGRGYQQWFLIMAFLHPFAWLMLWGGGVHQTQSSLARRS